MSLTIFADTFYWLALARPRDAWHAVVWRWAKANPATRIVTTDEVLGEFLNALIAFLSIGTSVFFFVVQPVNVVMRRRQTKLDPDSETRACTECLSSIPVLARKCAFCGSSQAPATSPVGAGSP